MKHLAYWLWLAVLAAMFGLMAAGCEPETIEDESDLPWSPPEDWESGAPIGF